MLEQCSSVLSVWLFFVCVYCFSLNVKNGWTAEEKKDLSTEQQL